MTIREFRILKGMNQRELGEVIGVSQTTIKNIEHGLRKLKDKEIDKLKELFPGFDFDADLDKEPINYDKPITIKELRAIKGLSQQQLAEMIGKTKIVICRCELNNFITKKNFYAIKELFPEFKIIGPGIEEESIDYDKPITIKELRAIKGLSQQKLGEMIGKSSIVIRSAECNDRITEKNFRAIEKLFPQFKIIAPDFSETRVSKAIEEELIDYDKSITIKRLRAIKGLSQQELGEMIGKSSIVIQHAERKNRITEENFRAIEKLFPQFKIIAPDFSNKSKPVIGMSIEEISRDEINTIINQLKKDIEYYKVDCGKDGESFLLLIKQLKNIVQSYEPRANTIRQKHIQKQQKELSVFVQNIENVKRA